jgi:RecT family
MSNLIPVGDMGTMADAIVKSQFYGFKSKEQVLAVMLVAQAEGKHPATVVQEYDIIQGRPALKSQAMLARFQLSGGKVEWHEMTPRKVSGTFSHPNGGSLTIEWTIEMAKQAGVYREGSGWTKYPEDMLTARVISRAVRKVYPACILGHYAVEEVVDFEPMQPKNITPKAPEVEYVSEIIDNPVKTGRFKLILPGGEVYDAFDNAEEYMEAYKAMVGKIRDSKKLEMQDKILKMADLKEANTATRALLTASQLASLNADSPKQEASDL